MKVLRSSYRRIAKEIYEYLKLKLLKYLLNFEIDFSAAVSVLRTVPIIVIMFNCYYRWTCNRIDCMKEGKRGSGWET